MEGGGALQSSWFPKNFLVQNAKLPHGQRVRINWKTKEERDRYVLTETVLDEDKDETILLSDEGDDEVRSSADVSAPPLRRQRQQRCVDALHRIST